MKKKGNLVSILIIALVVLILAGAGIGFLLLRDISEQQDPQLEASSGNGQTVSTTVPYQTDPTMEESVPPTGTAPVETAPTVPTATEPLPTEPAMDPTEPTVETGSTMPVACEHSYGDWQTLEAATCMADGTRMRVCENCGVQENGSIEATDHSYGSWKTVKMATCTAAGVKTHMCTVCGKEESQSVSATGHTYDSGTVIREATSCTDTGIVSYTCTICSDSYERTIKGSHKLNYSDTSHWWACEYCDQHYNDFFYDIEPVYSDADPDSALAKDTITLKEKTYTGKLSSWSERWFEYRSVIYGCMMSRSESYLYGNGTSDPYMYVIHSGATKEEAEAVREEFILFLDDFEDVFGWRPVAPTVEYYARFKGYSLAFDMNKMYSTYTSQIKKLSNARKEEIVADITAYLVHAWGLYDGMSVYNACFTISGNLWQWAYYDWSLRLHDAIDGFALFTCVCDGYSQMFLSIADYCGINADMVTGSLSGKAHAWNKVTFSDGTVRYLDITNLSNLMPAEFMPDYKW